MLRSQTQVDPMWHGEKSVVALSAARRRANDVTSRLQAFLLADGLYTSS